MQFDLDMYDSNQDLQMSAQSTNINEELGQVEYIFSDKTGTLTCNVMELKKFSTVTTSYEVDQPLPGAEEVLMHLAVCHTVIIDPRNDKFNASSPDELALVEGAHKLGYSFSERDSSNVITIEGKDKFVVMNVLEFSSARKRMSVIIRNLRTGQIQLLTKGADSIIEKLLAQSEWGNYKTTMEFVQKFATEGLRTLLLTKRELSEHTYQEWNTQYQKASMSVHGREELVAEVNAKIEKDLVLIGSSAIEDKLQEGVGETIRSLKAAGIKLWVLTGDKIETAVNIGYAAGLLDDKMN